MLKLNKFKKNTNIDKRKSVDRFSLIAIIVALLALLALIIYNVIPVRTADIKVPVATDKSSYYPGQKIGGIFFGEVYYKGEVRVLREVFCKNYRGIIKPPAEQSVGDLFSTSSTPQKLEGESVTIGNLPTDIPIGLNCVLQFTNIYRVNTPFGTRVETYQYYTQNFAIITKERRDQLDCEATGKSTQECQQKGSVGDADRNEPTSSVAPIDNPNDTRQFSPDQSPVIRNETPQPVVNNNDNSTTNNTTNNPPAEPAPKPPTRICTVDILFIEAFCRTEY